MNIIKRNGSSEPYCLKKIRNAVESAFLSVDHAIKEPALNQLLDTINNKIINLFKSGQAIQVETIQDQVEQTLMEMGYYEVAKSYILYRENRSKMRAARQELFTYFAELPQLNSLLKKIQNDFDNEIYNLNNLKIKFLSFYKADMPIKDRLTILIKASAELTTVEAPKWEFIAARLLMLQFEIGLIQEEQKLGLNTFYEKISYLTRENLYGSYILQEYSRADIDKFETYLDYTRNELFTYSGLELLLKRYVIHTRTNIPLESVQEMYLGIAMHLAMQEENNRDEWVLKFYDMLSKLQVTMATPTLSNARKPYHQLSSCFIDTVPDSLDGIYRSIDNFAKVSKFGGGMGMYFGKVRASGGSIRGFEGVAGGVIRWIKLANDTAVAVDQLGMRQGAVAVYLDAWHKDLPEFLNLRTNNGDDRMKAHDVFPAVCYPDYFWKSVRDNIEGNWYMMCPHDILMVKGYCLEDSFGEEWEQKYLDCIQDSRISKRVIPIKDLVRLIIKSAVETGTPFTFNRDHVNYANPNNHKGIIYCSNLCTEIAQNMSEIQVTDQSIQTVNGETVVVTTTKPGDFVVCNLASLCLGNIDVNNLTEVMEITKSAMRALDNVIDLNFFPIPYAKITNESYRPVGLGVSGYHHMLAKYRIKWESDEHLAFADKVFEDINYAAISASCENAIEKGSYSYFSGSDWATGVYFDKRNYCSPRWLALKDKVAKEGLRNGYLIAVAPTSSTSILVGTTAGLDPIMNRYFLEEKKNGLMPRVAPDLSPENFWLYKNAHYIDQIWSIRANGIRQRHIDQAQSMNLYITNEYTFKGVLELYLQAWEEKVKTIYYIRSKSLEVEECEVCAS